jgi:protein-S-isoprenylcysteine O-methyltransferase Ste14
MRNEDAQMLLSVEQTLSRHSFAIGRLAVKAGAVALVCFVASQLVSYPARFYELHEFLECIGVMMMLVCIAGTAWSSLYRTSGAEAIGPYSLCRNPVSVFCAIGFVGAGAQIGHVSILLMTGALAGLFIFLRDIEEEKRLRARHGDNSCVMRGRCRASCRDFPTGGQGRVTVFLIYGCPRCGPSSCSFPFQSRNLVRDSRSPPVWRTG